MTKNNRNDFMLVRDPPAAKKMTQARSLFTIFLQMKQLTVLNG